MLYSCFSSETGKYKLKGYVWITSENLVDMKNCMGLIRVMVFDTTFNNISAILWRSVLLVEETGGNQRPVASH